MAQANPVDIPQNFSTTLNVGGGIDNSQTSGIVLTSVTGLPTDGGILCFDWAATLDTDVAEYIEYTGISGNTLTGVTRGVEGIAAKAHSNGATVVGVVSRQHIKRVRDKLTGNDEVAIQDPNNNEIVKTDYNASAVNEITITNAATGNDPSVAATGGDSNINLTLSGKGTGGVTFRRRGRVTSESSSATPTINTDNADIHRVTALAVDITSMTTNLSGTPAHGDLLRIEITGTATRTIAWGASFEDGASVELPTTTDGTNMLSVGLTWNSATSKWRCIASD